MRQAHQKNRSRGRNRKPQNPLSRNYESNGPDVKIRGNASHIAEKYSSLARDALSNGDTVMAENYLQHAEHYNRLIAAAQAARAEEQAAMNNGRGPQPEVEDQAGAAQPDVAAKTTENAENANQDAKEDGAEAAPQKERRNTRSRRPRKPAAETTNAADGSGEQEPVAMNGNGASEEVKAKEDPVVAESVSEDAASLPPSITGGMQAEEA